MKTKFCNTHLSFSCLVHVLEHKRVLYELCVCVCAYIHERTRAHTHTHDVYICMYKHVYVHTHTHTHTPRRRYSPQRHRTTPFRRAVSAYTHIHTTSADLHATTRELKRGGPQALSNQERPGPSHFFHTISARPPKQPRMVRTFLKVHTRSRLAYALRCRGY